LVERGPRGAIIASNGVIGSNQTEHKPNKLTVAATARLPAGGCSVRESPPTSDANATERASDAHARGDIDVNTVPESNKATAIAATGQTGAGATVQVKLSPDGFFIDHPDPELGEALMADALGVADRDAMDGILRQLVRASVSGQKVDAVNLAFMISMIKSIKPRDAVEAMLVAQMVSVHVMAMRCACQLANADDIARQDSAARALGRLARTFPAQIDALNRYRNNGGPAITVQNVSVGDGGNAIVGNVTQHASVMVSDKRARQAKP
jgi:hypothetical protein